MIEKTKQEFVLRGKLKKEILLRTSINKNEYYLAPLQVEETEKDGQKVENEVDSIMLIFWKDRFPSPEVWRSISELKENQTVSVRGYYQGVDNGLWNVTELLEVEENDLFI